MIQVSYTFQFDLTYDLWKLICDIQYMQSPKSLLWAWNESQRYIYDGLEGLGPDMEAMHQSLEIMRTGKQEENPDFEEKIFNYGGNVVSKTVSEVGVFDMPNPYRYDILSISIFC